AASAALEARTADLRRAEAELEAIRQSHYQANDALHAAQGELGEAALAVSRLEERIRYVAEGRERIVRQRADLEIQHASWVARQADAGTERDGVAARIVAAEQAAAGFAARLAEHAATIDAAASALREAQAAAANDESRRHADLAARLGALKALQEKVQIEDKLKPWLARHGLESLPGLWRRVRIEPGWEPALEAALRERLGSLEIGRLDTVRAFAADAPPARMAFFTTPPAPIASEHRTLPRLTELLHLGDAGLTALLGDWLEGVYTAADLDA